MLNKNRGFALLVVLGFAAVLAVFTVAMASRTVSNLYTTGTRGQVAQASYAAQSGVQGALANLYDPISSPGAAGNSDLANAQWFVTERSLLLESPDSDMMSVSRFYHNIVGAPGRTEIAPDNTVIPQDFFYIISVGMVGATVDSQTYEIEGGVVREATTLGVTVGPAFPLMPQALYADGSINLYRTDIDHFDSRLGVKARYNGNGAGLMNCNFPEASVVVGHNDPSLVSLTQSRIDGHFLFRKASLAALKSFQESHDLPQAPSIAEPAWRFSIPSAYHYTGPNDTINGFIGSLPLEPRSGGIDPSLIQLDGVFSASASPYTSSDNGLTLDEGGIYLHEGNLEVSGTGYIRVLDTNLDGEIEDVILLVEGDIRFLGGEIDINYGGQPKNLKIYSVGENTQFFSDTAQVCALVAGKKMNINVINSIIWGALLGNNVSMSNSHLNFDVTLQNPTKLAENFNARIIAELSKPGIALSTQQLKSVPLDTTAPPSLGGSTPVIIPGPVGIAPEPDPELGPGGESNDDPGPDPGLEEAFGPDGDEGSRASFGPGGN